MSGGKEAGERPADVRLRGTLVRVLGVQVITLVLLWLVQQHFSR